ncbi:hypothetical protein ACFL3M_01145 [Patescibacteria group bacterium]
MRNFFSRNIKIQYLNHNQKEKVDYEKTR